MLKGTFRVTRVTRGHGEDYINVEVVDELSGMPFVELSISPQQFGLGLTGVNASCEFKFSHVDRVGKIRQEKEERVKVDRSSVSNDLHETLLMAAQPFCVDGWMPILREKARYAPVETSAFEATYIVLFVRFVDAKGEETT